MILKWRWKHTKHWSLSKLGPIELSVWAGEDDVWFSSFDVFNGDSLAARYGRNQSVFKTREAALKSAEKMATAWLKKLYKALDTKYGLQ